MSVITSQKITSYYDRFKTVEVTFSREIVKVTGLVTKQVYLKCGGDIWPCVVYAASFEGAKVAANVQAGLMSKLEQAKNTVSLRFCFQKPDTDGPVTFFVSARVSGQSPHGESKDTVLFSLQYTQRPPDDLIEIMGRVLDANVNAGKRKNDRIDLNPEVIRKLNLVTKDTAIYIQGVPRRCMVRDISFSGSKLIMLGVAKFLINREASLRLDFDDPRENFLIKGIFIRAEEVAGRKELLALALEFAENEIPMGYKIRINEYLGQPRNDSKGRAPEDAPASAPVPASAPAPVSAPGVPEPPAEGQDKL
ncbi:MAG: PilZ domain-containing protein [Treponema sp.]|jgi:hypothetical protein|nr:PilZ domain-containing protein [Treponema sp.]